MIERDPKAIAKHCRETAAREDLPPSHREMLVSYARFYNALADQSAKEGGHPALSGSPQDAGPSAQAVAGRSAG